jgi:hypothetical protein
MGNPIYYYESIEDATITVTGEASGFPKENMQDRNENTKWKAADNNAQNVNIDYGSNLTADSIVVGGNNFASIGAWMKAYYSDNGSDYTQANGTITIPATRQLITFSSETHRYWRITAAFESPPGSGPAQIGTIFIGTKLSHTINREWGLRQAWLSNVSARETIGNRVFTNKNGEDRRTWAYRFADVGETQRGNILTHVNTVNNMHKPFYVDLEADGTEYLVRQMGLESGLTDKNYQIYDSDVVRLVEEL